MMKKTMLIGEHGSGKNDLLSLLLDKTIPIHRAMGIEYYGAFINTPSEFLENRSLLRSLITTAADCEIMLMVINDQHKTSLFPPKFASLFNKTVLGVITQRDELQGNSERAKLFLHNAGITDILTVNIKTGQGLATLKKQLV